MAGGYEGTGQRFRGAMDVLGDRLQALGAVVHGVASGHDGQEHLRRANVRGRLLASDVLLARLERHAERRVAVDIPREADDPTRHLPLELLGAGKKRGVRTSVAHRDPKALRGAQGYIRAPLAGGFDQRQCEEVCGNGEVGTGIVELPGKRPVILDLAVRVRVLDERADGIAIGLEQAPITNLNGNTQWLGPLLHDGDGLRMAAVIHKKRVPFPAVRACEHRHGLGGGGALIQQRGVGQRQPGQVRHHRLEVEQRFEAALRDFRLVGRVLCVPARILEHVPQNHRRRNRAVVTHPDVAAEHLVLLREGVRLVEEFPLRERSRHVQFALHADGGRNGGV